MCDLLRFKQGESFFLRLVPCVTSVVAEYPHGFQIDNHPRTICKRLVTMGTLGTVANFRDVGDFVVHQQTFPASVAL